MVTSFRSKLLWIIVGLFLLVHSAPALAVDLDIDLADLSASLLTQGEFKGLTEEMGLTLSYLPLSPAESLGILGVDIGIEVTAANIREDRSYWTKVTEDPPSQIVLPKLHVQKGLPFGFDIGAVYAKVPQSNVSMVGGELKWAFISGNAVWPAVAVRGSYTRLLGVDDLDLETIGADLSISKGLAFVTPYAGIGQVWVRSKEKVRNLDLEKESLSLTKGFIGVKISLLIINFVAEADFSKIPLYSGRINIGF